jgi:hypothetical protein
MYKPDPNRPIGQSNLCVQNQAKSIPWIWEGVIPWGAITLLSAPEKIGKTTLLSLLLDRRRDGGQLLGRTVYPGKTVLCSEEDQRLWTLRQPPLDFGPRLVYHNPCYDYPSRGKWKHFTDDLIDLFFRDEEHDEDPFDLVVIDTAMSFLPLNDRNRKAQRWALGQLRRLTGLPTAFLILNQSRNMHRPLAAFADIVIKMETPRGLGLGDLGPGPTRRRTFTGVGRYPDTLQLAKAELNPEGTDYVLLPDSPAPPSSPPLLDTIVTLLTASPTPLTHRELLERWPDHPPRKDSLYRALTHGLERGLLTVSGTGNKTDVFRLGMTRAGEGSEFASAASGGRQSPD